MGPDPTVEISARPVPQEPMVCIFLLLITHTSNGSSRKYIIINLGMSENFGAIDFEHLTFPTHMRVDYIRVYQDVRYINIGCDPEEYPTLAYINESVETITLHTDNADFPPCLRRHIQAYTDPNLTTWREDYGQPFPKNSFIESC